MVIHKHGVADFDLITDKPECPMCHTAGTAETCGFMDCVFNFQGCKWDKDNQMWQSVKGVASSWLDATGAQFMRLVLSGVLCEKT